MEEVIIGKSSGFLKRILHVSSPKIKMKVNFFDPIYSEGGESK